MDTASFSPAVRELLSDERLCPLGPGQPNESQRPRLATLTAETLAAPQAVRRGDFARGCLAGLWLYHDFLDESHRLSQDIASVEGSYWHGILHRREPDYGNAAYWFRRVGRHPVFADLGTAASQLAAASGTSLSIPSPWDPFWFIDYCEACANGPESGQRLARLIQQREWELLFTYCYQRAIG